MVSYKTCACGNMQLLISPSSHRNFCTSCVISPKLEKEKGLEDNKGFLVFLLVSAVGPHQAEFLALHLTQLQVMADFQP